MCIRREPNNASVPIEEPGRMGSFIEYIITNKKAE